jgi:hypothetical protein
MVGSDRKGLSELFSSKKGHFVIWLTFALVCIFVFGAGCSDVFSNKLAGAFLGRAGLYDYSPTAIQIGNVQQFWWCGEAQNPVLQSQATDTILYATMDVSTNTSSVPVVVLAETPGAWDSAYTCNPKVIGGVFENPLGNGVTYSYALYYVATSSPAGVANSIGVAFSNDGIHWNKYPQPVIPTPSQVYYGVGQPALYNSDHKSGIWLSYEETDTGVSHFQATSTDGIHFTVQGEITTNETGSDLANTSWGDMAYDSAIGYWYALFNRQLRNPSTTGNILERGPMGVALYRIPQSSLLTGTTPWQLVKTFDTNLTGHEANFIAGFLRDQYGNLNVGPYPTLQIYTSISNPAPPWNATAAQAGLSADPSTWDIGSVQWVPGNQLVPFNSYNNQSVNEVTTGWIDPQGGFTEGSILGHLYEAPQQGATVPLYGCKSGSTNYFVSTDGACGGSLLLGVDGYVYPSPQPGVSLVPLYSCTTNQGSSVSNNPTCQGNVGEAASEGIVGAAGTLLGYSAP